MKNKTKILTAIFVLVLASVACGGSSVPAMSTPTDEYALLNAQSTSQALTALVVSPTSTITPRPFTTFAPIPFTVQAPATPMSTPLPATAVVNGSFIRQIYFAAGATSAKVIGGINPDQIFTYSFYVMGDQPAQMSLESENNDITMAIYDPNRYELLSPALKASTWQGYFKKEGYYLVEVYGGAATTKFNLSMVISARVTLTPEDSYVKLRNRTTKGGIMSYVVKAGKDQTLDVKINTSPDDAAFTIWGFTDGQPYARADAGTTSFSLLVPTAQDYIIDVIPQTGKPVNYTLFISLK